jgi:long-chain acyl-CoA synthetase
MAPDMPFAVSVRAMLQGQARQAPLAPYLIAAETGRQLSFFQMEQRSRSLAHWLWRQGLRPGDRIAVFLPNGLQSVRLLLGIMAAGYVLTPLNLLSTPEQLHYVLEHADCKLLFSCDQQHAALQAALTRLKRPIRLEMVDPDSDTLAGELDEAANPPWPTPGPGRDQLALMMYTSGTTGRPKAVALTHGNLSAGASFVSHAQQLGSEDRVLAVLPLYHINGQVVTVLAPLFHGGSLVMARRFSKELFWQQAEQYGCTWLNLVPTIIAYLLQAPAASDAQAARCGLRFCRSASAPLAPELHRAFEFRFGIGIIETMGLTETAAQVFSNPPDPSQRKLGSPGQAFGNQARIIDLHTGAVLGPGEPGEIQIRGPNVMQAYYKDPEETARAMDADGWLHTGDLAYRDPDDFYFITGRIKELIIKGGENIAPREIDEALLQHPAVLEAAAVGVPDSLYGQEIEAWVVLQPEMSSDEAQLRAFCLKLLGRFKTPRAIHFSAVLPKGPSGKVQRLKLLAARP